LLSQLAFEVLHPEQSMLGVQGFEFFWTKRNPQEICGFDWYAVGRPARSGDLRLELTNTTSARAKAHTRSTLAVCGGPVK
jgi:hypothetical protein